VGLWGSRGGRARCCLLWRDRLGRRKPLPILDGCCKSGGGISCKSLEMMGKLEDDGIRLTTMALRPPFALTWSGVQWSFLCIVVVCLK
jgi:hypothetical protein